MPKTYIQFTAATPVDADTFTFWDDSATDARRCTGTALKTWLGSTFYTETEADALLAAKAPLVSPSFTTPALGTPSAGVLTSCTGLPVSTGITGLGTGVATALAVNVGSAGAPVVLNGAGGTPSSLTLTNATGLPMTTGVTGVLAGANGGTGVANTGKTLTLGGNFTHSGAHTLTLTTTGNTSLTLPTSGTVMVDGGTYSSLTVTTLNATSALLPITVKVTSSNYTIGTTSSMELYGGVIYVDAACTLTIPAVTAGQSFTVVTIGAVAVSVDPNASDLIILDGTALSDGDKITNLSTAGDIAVFTYKDATGWYAATNGWTDTN